MIPAEQYKRILEVMPLLCVDVVIRNARGEYLLVKRVNEPLKGRWWVVGGRVHKNETLEQAVIRKVRQETSLDVRKMQPIGYYEAAFKDNSIKLATPFHAVSVVFAIAVANDVEIRLDAQSSEWKFAKKLPADFRVREFVTEKTHNILTSGYMGGL